MEKLITDALWENFGIVTGTVALFALPIIGLKGLICFAPIVGGLYGMKLVNDLTAGL
jgi:hypothetical protein